MITAKKAREKCLVCIDKHKPKELKIIEQMLDKQIKLGDELYMVVPMDKVPHLSYRDIEKHFSPFGYSITCDTTMLGTNVYKIAW